MLLLHVVGINVLWRYGPCSFSNMILPYKSVCNQEMVDVNEVVLVWAAPFF